MMKYTVSLIGRSLILGGGFGASIGQFLGQFADNLWQLIGVTTLLGIVVSLVCVLGIYSVQQGSRKQLVMDSELKFSKNSFLQRKKAA